VVVGSVGPCRGVRRAWLRTRTLRCVRPRLPRDWTPVQRIAGRNDGALACTSGPPRAVFHRFQRYPSGLLRSRPSPPVLTPPACLSAGCPSPRSTKAYRRHPRAHADAPLLGFRSPTALDNRGRPYIPAACSLRHHPSSGFPTLSTSFFALDPGMDLPTSSRASFATPALLGLTRDPLARPGLSAGTGLKHSGFPLQGFPRLRDEHVFARSPLVRFGSVGSSPFGRRPGRHSGRYRVSIAGPSALSRWRIGNAGLPEVSG
jgi:hypothetical protein